MGRIKHIYKLPAADLAAYVAWLQNPALHHTVGVGNGKAKSPKDTIYIVPFNVTLAPATFVSQSALTAAVTSLKTKVGSHAAYTINATTEYVSPPLRGYSAARISLRTGKSKQQAKNSHILTDRQYTPYGGTSLSMPFGKTTQGANESEDQIFEEVLKPQFAPGGVMPAGEQITLIKEKFQA